MRVPRGRHESDWIGTSGESLPFAAQLSSDWLTSLVGSADGSAWMVPYDLADPTACPGIGQLDGGQANLYLDDLCVYSFDIAPDGTVWAVAGQQHDESGGPISTYVIRPDLAARRVSINEPSAVDEPPGELITEEVEPGVVRVVGDGHREVSWTGGEHPAGEPPSSEAALYPDGESRVIVRNDGRVWIVLNTGYYELGREPAIELPGHDFMTFDDQVAVGPDGTFYKLFGWRPQSWTPAKGHELWSHDGSGWRREETEPGSASARNLTTALDGSVWVAKGTGVFQRNGTDWTRIGETTEGGQDSTFAVSNDGTRWILGPGDRFFILAADGQARLDAGWPDGLGDHHDIVAVGPDGTAWAHTQPDGAEGTSELLARHQGGEWTVYDAAPGAPSTIRLGSSRNVEVARDGSVWFSLDGDEEETCAGLVRFDGTSWSHHLADLCIYDFDIGPGDRVWATAGVNSPDAEPSGGLYIIDLKH